MGKGKGSPEYWVARVKPAPSCLKSMVFRGTCGRLWRLQLPSPWIHVLCAVSATLIERKVDMATVSAEELRAKTLDELKTQLTDLKKEQFNLRFQLASGQAENPSRARVVRREIARIKTVLGQSANAAK